MQQQGQTWYSCDAIPRKTLLVEPCRGNAVSLELYLDGEVIYGNDVANLLLSDREAERLALDILARLRAAREEADK